MTVLKDFKFYTRYSRTHQKDMEYAFGYVYNDDRFLDGELIYTTAIIKKDENTITTTSGTVYQLGGM